MIGGGLWLLAVASVALIAWIAIDTAGRQVTALAVTAPLPSPSGSGSSTGAAVPPSPVRSAGTSAISAQQSPSHLGIINTDGGRVRAQCTKQGPTLDGGYARPESGWTVRVLTRDTRLWVEFGSEQRAISVLTQCANGRPQFHERSGSGDRASRGHRPVAPVESPLNPSVPPAVNSLTVLVSPTDPVTPLPTVFARVRPTSTVTSGPPPAEITSPSPEQAGPAPTSTPDPAEVEALVQQQNEECAQPGPASEWCQTWSSLSDIERYALASQWLTTSPGASPTTSPPPDRVEPIATPTASATG